MDYSILAMAAPQTQAGAQAPNPLIQMAPFIIIFFIFYFLVIRPQKKRQNDHKESINKLKKGDKVVTAGGICGTVTNIKEKTVTVKIAETVKVEVIKSYITAVLTGQNNDLSGPK